MRSSGVAITLALVLAALAGAAIGYAAGYDQDPAPETFTARPLAASSPSYPVIPAVVVDDDPRPAMEKGLRTRWAKIGSPPFEVRIPVPRGWIRSNSTAGEWRWYPFPPTDANVNLYFLRVSQVAQAHRPMAGAVGDRITALRDASGVDAFTVESQRKDRFRASYVAGKHRRVSFEGFVPRDGVAYLRIAAVGREADRDGLADLFRRMMADTEV